MSNWTAWSACSKPCGGGTRTRTRTVTQQPANGGKPCPALTQSTPCNKAPCYHFECKKGSCQCIYAPDNSTHKSTQIKPAPKGEACANQTFPIEKAWAWDAVCGEEDTCYGTCNANKSACDLAFGQGLTAGCKADKTTKNHTQCFASAKLFKALKHQPASNTAFATAQKTDCNCTGAKSKVARGPPPQAAHARVVPSTTAVA